MLVINNIPSILPNYFCVNSIFSSCIQVYKCSLDKTLTQCSGLKNTHYIFWGAIRTFAFTSTIKMYVVLVCVQRSSWWVSSGPRRSVCTGGSATCRRHRAPIDSPSPGPGFCGGRACVKSTHSQHSSTSPAGKMSLAHRAPITRFVRLPISSPRDPRLLLWPSCCQVTTLFAVTANILTARCLFGPPQGCPQWIVSRILIIWMVGCTFYHYLDQNH